MTYLLIAFVLLIIISPLMWFRQSPRQNLIIDMRKEAARLGLIVSLSAPPDARQGETRLECITYKLPWMLDSSSSQQPRMENWLLVKGASRGSSSPWLPWQWLSRESSGFTMDAIGVALAAIPGDISALEARGDGLLVYWKEYGELEDVAAIYELLFLLRKNIRSNV
ncbi:MAG: hypothetical protein QNL64_00880 [Porticoccus sp.]